jgi:hypothetical protein
LPDFDTFKQEREKLKPSAEWVESVVV